ncbi:uncharacterized protein LOC120029470 isoform X2 [Salvelinus namaycush]|nr:uncharacterized protein LOC120029470 isoform X2 [Salvelinus namaycush]XP_038830629.1 uncharacterized protein LOC120029470 isoform X2 [Salvelinus namaycush]XP_038830630.1 uncharacterized protein LOC120029470 isoform X2 [Salvelinus namaycush]
MEVKLKALECHFTWGIKKADIKELDSIPEKLLDRIMRFTTPKYHATYFNLLAFLSHLEENNVSALEYLHKAESALKDRQDDTELLVTYANFAWVHYHSGNLDDVDAYIGKLEIIYKGIPSALNIQGSLPSVHGEKGWSLLRFGGLFYKRVKESFQKALEGEPDNASFNMGYALVLYRLEGMVKNKIVSSLMTAAANQLRKALSLEPDNSELMVLLALKLQKNQENKLESMKLIKEALRLSPDVPHVLRYVAKYFKNEGSINESLQVLGKALELSPNSHFLHHQIGLCHKQQLIQMFEQKRKGGEVKAKVEVCICHFSRAVELKPSNIHARVNLAEAYGNNYQLEEAMKIFTVLLEDMSLSDSDKQHCYTAFGLFLFYKKRDEDGAVTQFKKAYQIPIESWERKEAGKRLKQIAERWQDNKKRVGVSPEILMTAGAKQLRKALSLEPDNSELMVLLALKLQKNQENKIESLKLTKEALRLSPDVPHVLRYVAKYFKNEGSINECLQVLGKALELSPNSHFLHHQIGLCHKQQLIQMFEQKRKGGEVKVGQIKAKVLVCIRHFSRAVDLKPSNIHARVNLAEAYGNNYQLEEAMKIFTVLLEDKSLSDSDKQHCYTTFGLFLFYKKRDEDGAVTQFKKAYQIPIESWERKEAGKRLKQIAERWQDNKKRVGVSSEILMTADANQLRKALSLEPDNSELMVLLALKLQKNQENKIESLKLTKEALRLSPDVPHVLRYVAKYFKNEGSINECLQVLGKALELSPNSHFLHHQIGLCHKQQLIQMFEQKRKGGQIKAKVEVCICHFSRAVELKPSNIHARVNLAEAYGNNYQLEEAMKIFINLVKDESLNDSDKQHCYTSFGLFLFHKKKDEGRAVTQFKKAYQIQNESWDRKEAGKKLKQIAERCQTNKRRVGEASEILAFLATEDKEEPRRVNVHSPDTDDLTDALGKGMKLK